MSDITPSGMYGDSRYGNRVETDETENCDIMQSTGTFFHDIPLLLWGLDSAVDMDELCSSTVVMRAGLPRECCHSVVDERFQMNFREPKY